MITISKKLIAASIPQRVHKRYDLNRDSIMDDDVDSLFPDIESGGDSEFSFADDSCSDIPVQNEVIRKMQITSPSPMDLKFEKLEIAKVSTSKYRLRSGLTKVLGHRPSIESQHKFRGKDSRGIKLEIFIFEFGLDRSSMITVQLQNDRILVEDLIAESINNFIANFPNQRLQSDDPGDYELRFLDDDVLNDSELHEDDLDPALNRKSIFFDFIKLCKQNVFRLVLCCALTQNEDEMKRTESEVLALSDHDHGIRERRCTMEQIGKVKEQLFVRIQIIGPHSSDECSVMISLNAQSISSLILRDLFNLLNRKKQSNAFHPQFFQFCYRGKSGAIPNGIKLSNLRERTLIIFPKTTLEMNPDDRQRAMEYEFVRLANAVTENEAFKMDKADVSRRKYPVVLLVNPPKNHLLLRKMKNIKAKTVIIDIGDITDIQLHKGFNRKQLMLSYRVARGHGTAKRFKQQIYEMEDKATRDVIVRKLKYLCVLHKVKSKMKIL